MHASPQTTQLSSIFQQLDKQKKGYITHNIFEIFIHKQPRKLVLYEINNLFELLPDGKMNKQAFIVYMMGYRMNMEQLAISRFTMQKQFSKHVSQKTTNIASEIKKSQIKLSVASNTKQQKGEKHRLFISLGYDKPNQDSRYEQYTKILKRKPAQVVGIIKFKVIQNDLQIKKGIQALIQNSRGLLTEIDQQIARIINLFNFVVQIYDEYIYIFIEINHVFIQDMVKFMNQMIQTLNQKPFILLNIKIQSNYLKGLVLDNLYNKMKDLEVEINLSIDSEILTKIKTILGNQTSLGNQKQNIIGIMLLLFKNISLCAEFQNSEKLLKQLNIISPNVNNQLSSLKDMQILQTIQGFLPSIKQLVSNLKQYGKGDGQIAISLRNIFATIDFSLEIQELFDLL